MGGYIIYLYFLTRLKISSAHLPAYHSRPSRLGMVEYQLASYVIDRGVM